MIVMGGDTYSTSFFESQPTEVDSAKLEFERVGKRGVVKINRPFSSFSEVFRRK